MTHVHPALAAYCRSGRNKVNGWFTRNDAALFLALLSLQEALGVSGGMAEIGVHHGKSFIPLCLALRPGEKAMCIDVFEAQEQNADASGQGDQAVLATHLSRFGIDGGQVVIHAGSSLDLTIQDITQAVGETRFFSVDGGHWHDLVVNDLDLAGATLNAGGIIALDDFLSKAWPDVSHGFFDWHRTTGGDFVPIAMGTAKLYLARKGMAEAYRDGLMANPDIRARIYKTYDFLGMRVPILINPYPAFVIAAKNRLAKSHSGLLATLLAFKRRHMS